MKKNFTITEISKILKDYKPKINPPKSGYRLASVFIPFYPDPDDLSLVFTKRPDHLNSHSGQISFPGGTKDPADKDDLATALRETKEEIGVDPSNVEVWGQLKSGPTVNSNYWVTPFVGLIPFPYPFKLNAYEVERLIIAPLSHLLDPENFSEDFYSWNNYTYRTQLYTYGQDVIWGLTARILNDFLFLLRTGREPKDTDPLIST
ncbi:MAG: CoA pyrophosphatase [Deltaproteobacteria bacterium]|nr:CoA pyrophosphatase [Deltaproteobacteria bacterium]